MSQPYQLAIFIITSVSFYWGKCRIDQNKI